MVVLVWLGGIAYYLQSAQSSALRPHIYALVNNVQSETVTTTSDTPVTPLSTASSQANPAAHCATSNLDDCKPVSLREADEWTASVWVVGVLSGRLGRLIEETFFLIGVIHRLAERRITREQNRETAK